MADNIRNFNDYRKKANLDKQETEEINIEIQDPLDFLSDSERAEYYRTQQEAMDKERESLSEDSPEYYFDDDVSQKPEKEKEIHHAEEQVHEKREPVHKKEAVQNKESAGSPVEKKKAHTEKEEHRKNETEHRKARHRVEDEEWFDEDEDREGGINPYILVRIASVFTGVVVLVFLAMLFKVKIYDTYLKPDPDDITGIVEVGMLDGYTYVDDTVTTTTELNLRNTPSTASDDFIVTMVPKGTVLERKAVSDDGTWAQVLYDGEVLYCVMKYLTVNE